MTQVLLAIDQSSARSVADAVIRQFSPAQTRVHVLHVVTDRDRLPSAVTFAEGPTAADDVLAFDQSAQHRGEELVAAVVNRLTAAGFEACSEVRVGDPEQVILDCAAMMGAEVIVIGSQWRGSLLSGSVSAAVMRRAHCPVEVVPCPQGLTAARVNAPVQGQMT
jgi:nucleotide-binding universal stress UspA family protein